MRNASPGIRRWMCSSTSSPKADEASAKVLMTAVQEAYTAGLSGKNACGTG